MLSFSFKPRVSTYRNLLNLGHLLLALVLLLAGTRVSAADIGWPRQVERNGTTLVYYQPQVDEWKDYKELTARMAFSLTFKTGKQVMGVATLTCATEVNKDEHAVYIHDVVVKDVRSASLSPDSVAMMKRIFTELIPASGETISLERLMADVDRNKTPAKGIEMKNDPPAIFYSTVPAVVLMVEGDPVLASIEKTKLQFVVNTNWDLFFDKKEKNYYLLVNNAWLTAKELQGLWTLIKTLPKDMSNLPAGENFDDVIKRIPPDASAKAPKIFFSKTPAELILVRGEPVYSKITGTNLMYVANTDNDVFLDKKAKQYYILLSGRWYRADAFEGPWSYASNDLPADFSKIPSGTERARVLASVPGTPEAEDAVLLAQIPVTAVINKDAAEAKVKVTYTGDPQFKPIENTKLQYATNTQSQVVKVGELYYLCSDAVWFMSPSATGPWEVADYIPKEIYSIPPSSPVYNITYVTQKETSDTTVESSYTSGYTGAFVFGMAVGACVMWGTGWYYPPYMYYGPGMMYPYYRPYPYAYGCGAVYNPYTGAYGVGRSYYGPYGTARSAAGYNPSTGRYGHAASVHNAYGGRGYASTYNPYTGTRATTRQGYNAYGNWGTTVASRGNQWVQTGHVSGANGSMTGYRTSSGNSGVRTSNGTTVVNGKNGTYAGNDGNVYKKNNDGSWSKYNNGNWEKPTQHNGSNDRAGNNDRQSAQTTDRLNSSHESRQRGQSQTRDYQNYQRSGSGNYGGGNYGGGNRGGGGGGFRGGGGGFRGGGGRR